MLYQGKDLTPQMKEDLELYELLMRVNDDQSVESEKKCPVDLHYEDLLATPIIHVFSVSIESKSDNDLLEIYGSIQGNKGQETSFHLYDRASEDAETILSNGTLSLIGPVNGIFFPFVGINLDIYLKDRIRDVEVIKGSINLDHLFDEQEEVAFDKFLKVAIPGDYGIAYVYYAIFQFGMLGTIEVAITELKDSESVRNGFVDICGSVVAGYGNGKQYCSNDDESQNLKTVLLRKPFDRPMRVIIGNPIALLRNVVVVPAYSSIKIEAKLRDSFRNIIIDDHVEIDCRMGESVVHINSQYARLRVIVRWSNAYVELYKKPGKALNTSDEDINNMGVQKKPRVFHDKQHQFTSDVVGISKISLSGIPYHASRQVEVFSVCVGGITTDISAVCGMIFVDDAGLKNLYIYDREESSYEVLADDCLASIESAFRPIKNSEFYMGIYMRDPVQDLEVSRGFIHWYVARLVTYMSWYNKRLCSIIRGNNGYAAVHYMIFSDAFAASIVARIIFSSPDDIPVNVCGHIWASYSGLDYSKNYQKKYYRSRLFNLPQYKSVKLKTGSDIPLCKSLVSVPAGYSLFIEVDLMITRDGNSEEEETVSGIEEFENNMSSTCKYIKGLNYTIELSVKYLPRDYDFV